MFVVDVVVRVDVVDKDEQQLKRPIERHMVNKVVENMDNNRIEDDLPKDKVDLVLPYSPMPLVDTDEEDQRVVGH
jgi:hypothetical protein